MCSAKVFAKIQESADTDIHRPSIRWKYCWEIVWPEVGHGRSMSVVDLTVRASGTNFLAFPLSEQRREQACHLTVSPPLCTLQMWLWQTMNHQSGWLGKNWLGAQWALHKVKAGSSRHGSLTGLLSEIGSNDGWSCEPNKVKGLGRDSLKKAWCDTMVLIYTGGQA